MNNLKYFYKGLEKIGAGRKFDVNKLAKARYQDNLETIQWLKRYLEKGSPQDNYNPLQRRNNEAFFSHHSQKTSFITKPVKMGQSPSLNSLNFSFKKEVQSNQENQRGDKVDQIKRILSLKESNDVKIYLIG